MQERAVHSPVNGTTAIPWRSSRKRLTLLERLRGCEEAWCPKEPWSKEEAQAALSGAPTGSFLVLRNTLTREPHLLCVSSSDQHAPVTESNILCTGKVFHLSGSRLSFSDLTQLVLFYSFTRDVLPVCLCLPQWIYNVTENKDYPSEFHPNMWLNASSEPSEEHSNNNTSVMCTIQLTSSSGALCVINPLYLHEHGDEWLTQKTTRIQSTVPTKYKRDNRRLSTTRAWSGAGLHNKRAISLEQEPPVPTYENTGLTRARSADSSKNPDPTAPAEPPTPPSGVVLRRPSRDSPLTSPSTAISRPFSAPVSSEDHHNSPAPQSPHRVSWVEDGIWLPPPKVPSHLNPPSLELDSLSISSIEEEQDPATPTSTPHSPSTQRLANKVKNRFSAVGQALGGLVSQKKKLNYRVQEISERKGATFGESVKLFVEAILQKSPEKDGLTEFLQDVRASLTSLREMLLDNTEIQVLLDSMTDISDAEFDIFVEQSIHKVALKPLSSHLYGCIQTSRSSDGTLDRLLSNKPRLQYSGMEQLGGSAGVGVPDSTTLESIRQKWDIMHKAYSPNKKVQILLKVCKTIYHSMSINSNNTGAVFGADDFLPCLTWVLLQCDLITIQVDTDYMMELLDPTQLQGEVRRAELVGVGSRVRMKEDHTQIHIHTHTSSTF
ncbi:ras and Rab interactor 2 isoform X3 [Boleophthalmus pectinirostris]|uniref:ras and Rab interactor 2 isoform X3 n=1 Tax=Boleophthalmus pectinirostris TaxID=150288 RepID=UPI00243274B9|nr:ras and Rab interactor 2 isoform X3 [Boleophthalmus pectinirostris]